MRETVTPVISTESSSSDLTSDPTAGGGVLGSPGYLKAFHCDTLVVGVARCTGVDGGFQ